MQSSEPAKKDGVLPVVGGILIIIAGLIELGYGGMLLASESFAEDIPLVGGDISDILTVCGVIMVLLGLVALLGGVFAVQRKRFGLAVLGGIVGLLGWFIPGLIGLILVAISRKDFK